MKYVFGIDLGTTYSCIAYIDEYGKPVVLKNSEGLNTTPSVVLIESQDSIVVGTEAKRSTDVEPERTISFIKRKMGKKDDKVIVDGTEYSAPEISAYILKKLVKDANEDLKQNGALQEGEEIRDVVITCPAYFGMNERQATKTAGELAGLNVLDIINEPTAAAISYGAAGAQKNETVLVYDLGGGTFDITVMNIQNNQISVICTGGDDTLGGKDWDEALMNYALERYTEENDEEIEDAENNAALYNPIMVEYGATVIDSIGNLMRAGTIPSWEFLQVLNNPNGYYILPVLAAATQFLQTKLNPTETPQQGGNSLGVFLKYVFPLFSRWICLSSSAAFAIYWLTANVIAILQNVLIGKYLDRKEAKEKASQENA